MGFSFKSSTAGEFGALIGGVMNGEDCLEERDTDCNPWHWGLTNKICLLMEAMKFSFFAALKQKFLTFSNGSEIMFLLLIISFFWV